MADDGCFFSASARAVGGAAMEAVGEAAGLSGRSGAVCVGRAVMQGAENSRKQEQQLFGRHWRRELLAWMLQEPMPQGLLVGSPCRGLVR